MKSLTLFRTHPTPDGTFGVLGPWATVEEEDLGNRRNISSILPGSFVCRRTQYHGGGYETFEITNVPSRDRILFHVANTEEDIAGCVGIGMQLGVLNRQDEDTGQIVPKLAVVDSQRAFDEFMSYWKGVNSWVLHIREIIPSFWTFTG